MVVLLSLIPGPALAEVCDKVRPKWTPGSQATGWDEALHLFTTVPAITLLMASLIVVVKRSQWGALGMVVLWSGFVSLIAFFDDPFVTDSAISEGCIGSPALFIGAVTAICIAMILYTLPRETRL